MGDFNSHSDLWGSEDFDTRGRIIEKLLGNQNLFVLNNGSPTRICPKDGHSSAIDLTIVTESLFREFDWSVEEDLYGSDHFPVILRCSNVRDEPGRTRRRWKFESADWENFKKSIRTPNEASVKEITSNIIKAAEKHVPRTSGKVGKRALPWWNEEIEEAIKKRRKLLRKLRKMCHEHPKYQETLAAFQSARNKARKTIKESKRKSWSSFLIGISPQSTNREIWRRINCFRGGKGQTINKLLIHGNLVTDTQTVADQLADEFFKASADSSMHPEHLAHRETVQLHDTEFEFGENHFYNVPFTTEELMYALKTCKGQSTGPDSIGYPMLQHLPFGMLTSLLEAYNKVWTSGKIPAEWKEGIVVPIPKPGKNPQILGNQRPITLVSCMGKVLEKMVSRRLTQLLEQKGVLGDNQFGFRAGLGVEQYLADLEEEMDGVFESGQFCDMVLLDLTKAYDTAWRTPILKSLEKWGIGGRMARYMKDFLSERCFRVAVGNVLSSLRIQENGVPQGTVLAVVSFLIRMTELDKYIPRGVTLRLFADDILLTTTDSKPFLGRKRIQKGLTAVETWTILHGFQLSANKSNLLHVTRRRKQPALPELKTESGVIKEVQSARLLGVKTDKRFNFIQQAHDVKAAVESRNRIINIIGGKNNCAARSTLMNVHKSIIQSRMFYGVGLSSKASENTKKRIEPAYTAGIRSASGAFRTSPVSAVMAESGQLPFKYAELQALCSSAIRIQSKSKSGETRTILERARSQFSNVTGKTLPAVEAVQRLSDRPWNQPSPTVDWAMQETVKAGDPVSKVAAAFGQIREKYKEFKHLYTDGSVAEDVVGAGIVDGSMGSTFRLPHQCSIFSAEAFAIRKAIEQLEDNYNKIVIFSDSASVLSAVEAGQSKHPWIQHIEEKMADGRIVLCWIPGHCGIPGNEKADEFAGKAGEIERETVAIPAEDIQRWMKQEIRMAWEQNWLQENDTQLRHIKPTTKAGKDREDQTEQHVLTRLRIGHTRLTHSSIFSKQTSECETCGEKLTVQHILLECRAYEAQRQATGLATSLYEILHNNPESESKLLRYLRKTGLFNKI